MHHKLEERDSVWPQHLNAVLLVTSLLTTALHHRYSQPLLTTGVVRASYEAVRSFTDGQGQGEGGDGVAYFGHLLSPYRSTRTASGGRPKGQRPHLHSQDTFRVDSSLTLRSNSKVRRPPRLFRPSSIQQRPRYHESYWGARRAQQVKLDEGGGMKRRDEAKGWSKAMEQSSTTVPINGLEIVASLLVFPAFAPLILTPLAIRFAHRSSLIASLITGLPLCSFTSPTLPLAERRYSFARAGAVNLLTSLIVPMRMV